MQFILSKQVGGRNAVPNGKIIGGPPGNGSDAAVVGTDIGVARIRKGHVEIGTGPANDKSAVVMRGIKALKSGRQVDQIRSFVDPVKVNSVRSTGHIVEGEVAAIDAGNAETDAAGISLHAGITNMRSGKSPNRCAHQNPIVAVWTHVREHGSGAIVEAVIPSQLAVIGDGRR